MFSNCIFMKVIFPENNAPIKINNTMITFYLDSCSFIDNDANSVIFDIQTRVKTFSKICCTSITRTKRSDNIPLFIKAEILLGSFIKIIDTTIYGTNEKTEAQGLCHFSGEVSLLFNNLNISKIRTTGDRGIFRITNCVCSSIQMSTFKLLNADKDGDSSIIYIQPRGITHKISFCNFLDNKYSGHLIRPDLQSAADVLIYKCVFANPDKIGNSNNFVYFNSDNSVLIFRECSFKSNSIGDGKYQTDNCIFYDPKINTLQHYLYQNECKGPIYDNPLQCPDDICSEDNVCENDAFDFKGDDIPYPPTSDYFTDSFQFTKSNFFSQTNNFSESLKFSSTNEFTKTIDFSSSFYFTNSKMFNKTEIFSSSYYFSNSAKFTKTSPFSVSTVFTNSNQFSTSFVFTNSAKFQKTTEFSRSYAFSNSGKFSFSSYFSKSFVFSESSKFTKSDNFLASKAFSKSEYFTKTKQFTETNAFSRSSYFTKSFYFTYSSPFEPTLDFNASTPSLKFTFSNEFSYSEYFSNSKSFSKTSYFTKSLDFTKSNIFTESYMFTHSANFEFTKTLEAKRPIVINIRSDKSNKISTGVKIGIGIIAGTAVLAIVVAGMLFLKKRNRKIEDFDEETFEINNSASTVFVSQNPLINLLENDDPFEDEFD